MKACVNVYAHAEQEARANPAFLTLHSRAFPQYLTALDSASWIETWGASDTRTKPGDCNNQSFGATCLEHCVNSHCALFGQHIESKASSLVSIYTIPGQNRGTSAQLTILSRPSREPTKFSRLCCSNPIALMSPALAAYQTWE
jgi:hypothetical protein